MEIIKDEITVMPSETNRIYHTIEGSHDGYYFFAKTDNSHRFGYGSDGINKGAVYILDVWEGGHPVGRDSIKGKGIHVANDFIAGYFRKWSNKKPETAKEKKVVKEIVQYLESISNDKAKASMGKQQIIIKNANSEIVREGWNVGDSCLAEIDDRGAAWFKAKPFREPGPSDWCVLYPEDYSLSKNIPS